MIHYNPTNGDVYTGKIDYKPRTCFLMTQLGELIPSVLREIRVVLNEIFAGHSVEIIDANSIFSGKDFLTKIWHMILEVPLGVGIIHEGMSKQTYANIFYELGMLQTYGKEYLVIKTQGTPVPSDLIRTEYIEFNNDFKDKMEKFVTSFFRQTAYYVEMAEQLENNPLLAIDYLKRAYLITGENEILRKAKEIFNEANIVSRSKNSEEILLADFCT